MSGQLRGELSIDTSKAEKALGNVRSFVQFLGKDLKDLSNIVVTPGGQLQASFSKTAKETANYSKETESATTKLRTFYREQRVQDRTTREATQSLLGFTFGLTALLNASDSGSEGAKRFERTILATVTALQGGEFAATGLGIGLEKLGGRFATFGLFLQRSAGWIGVVIGLTAGLVSFFRDSGNAAEDAEPKVEKYKNALQRIQETIEKTRNLRADKVMAETQVKVLEEDLRRYTAEKMKSIADLEKLKYISEDERKRLIGLVRSDLKAYTDQQKGIIDIAKAELEDIRDKLGLNKKKDKIEVHEDFTVGPTRKDMEEGLKRQEEQQQRLFALADQQRKAAIDGRKEEYDANEKLVDQDVEKVKLQYELQKIGLNGAIVQLQALALQTNEVDKRLRIEADIAGLRKRAAEQQQQAIDQQLDQASRVAALLGRAFSDSGDNLISKLAEALQIAIQIAKVMNKSGEKSPLDILEVLANVAGIVGLFDVGGYTGSGDPGKIAGAAHYEEVIFEAGITKRYKNQLMQLRSNLQAGKNFSEAAASFTSPSARFMGSFPASSMQGAMFSASDIAPLLEEIRALRRDRSSQQIVIPAPEVHLHGILDGQKFVRKEMPKYEEYQRKKKIDG